MKTGKNEFNDIAKKHNIKIKMCGDDKTIPKIIHARIKSTCDEVMDPFSDVDWKEDHLYYADPLFWFNFCRNNISKKVTLLHDYPLWEWTICVTK